MAALSIYDKIHPRQNQKYNNLETDIEYLKRLLWPFYRKVNLVSYCLYIYGKLFKKNLIEVTYLTNYKSDIGFIFYNVEIMISWCCGGRYSSVGSDVALESRGTAIDPRVRHIFT